MNDGQPTRTWDTVCSDCLHWSGNACLALQVTAGGDDCIAAICAAFIHKGSAQNENGDA